MAIATYHSTGHPIRAEAGRRPNVRILACPICPWAREVEVGSAVLAAFRHAQDTILVIS